MFSLAVCQCGLVALVALLLPLCVVALALRLGYVCLSVLDLVALLLCGFASAIVSGLAHVALCVLLFLQRWCTNL